MNVANVKRNFFLVFISIVGFFSACTKITTTDIGSGLIPPVDGVITKDTSIEVFTKNAGDSIIRPGLGDNHVLGYVNDPLFGKTTAKINVQLKPPFFPYTFQVGRDSLHVDSVVLVLGYRGVWGDSTQALALRVFEISNEDLPFFTADSVYTNLSSFPTLQQLTENFLPKMITPMHLYDSFHVFQDSGINQIRIRLNLSLGERFLNSFDSSAFANDSAFNLRFRGFQIAADQEIGNSLLKINLLDANTKLALYYHYNDPLVTGQIDTTVRYFTAGSVISDSFTARYASAHSNYIVRDRSGAEIASYYPSANPVDSLLFLETSPGVFSTIKIPGLSGLPNIIIHRAELLMEQVPDNIHPYNLSDQYLTPPLLFLAAYAQDSMRRFILFNDVFNVLNGSSGTPDLGTFGSFPVNHYDASTGRYSYSYNFNISRYVQDIVTKKDSSYNLILYAPFNEPIYSSPLSTVPASIFNPPLNTPACGRIRLRGGSTNKSDLHRMRLHIIYSLI